MTEVPSWPPLDCPDCDGKLHLQVNPFQRGNRWIYFCENRPACRGLMSAHPSGEPCGVPADQATRTARNKLHEMFDPLWFPAPRLYQIRERDPDAREQAARNIRRAARNRAYAWLADQLGLTKDECHISHFDIERCRDAWRAIKAFRLQHGESAPLAIRSWWKDRQEAA